MKTKISLLFFFLVFSISSVFAHALWIETASTGKKGQAQEVKVFFGEYESNEPDSAAKWFSNLKDFKLILTAPNGTTKVLTSTPDINFFKANFTPDEGGFYRLSIVHEVAAIYEHAKIEYYTYANVFVTDGEVIGDGPKYSPPFPSNALFTVHLDSAPEFGKLASPEFVFHKSAFANQSVSIIDPGRKKQELKTDESGKCNFKAEKNGRYFIEAFKEDKTPGKLNGKNYDKVWHLVTYTTEVK
ncbi:DUF4198 domain-containing protein [Pedobacter sp. SG908]|uniref:DUF4198 domain-containing protein n=1 Tax=Pedobacter sp. SG908 TaxID=2587135 RepID=UPI00141FCD51|nr:DUF4198 domain-containing protein [Pedobacter sp. SG908]NII85918.1 putative GH25 family protein [Pedobacter sp. SG908]